MKNKKYFNYIIIAAVLIIPFMYSFFYLKAYWDPYGEGNIDNLPVAIVNNDKGDNGKEIVNNIIDSKKLKISVVSEDEAMDGLYDKTYYAVINIPSDFTESINSAATTNKKHATITYSPNQKSNYLSSQIINNVVSTVEKNLDNKINSGIVDNLANNISEVPEELEVISDGFEELNNGTSKLKDGSQSINSGTLVLKDNYNKFNEGVKSLKEGTDTLANSVSGFNELTSGLNELTNGVNTLKNGSDTLTSGLNSYVSGVNDTLTYTNNLVNLINLSICPKVVNGSATQEETQMCAIAQGLSMTKDTTGNTTVINYLKTSGNALIQGNNSVNNGINILSNQMVNLKSVEGKISELQNGANNLLNGADTLYNSSLQIQTGINTLADGTNSLNNGLLTLNDSVRLAKEKIDSNIDSSKKELKKVEGLSKYSEEPVNIKTKEVNKVSSYGTAFTPFFISIALWVGCLMLYIVLYYDKEERFKKLSIQNKNYIQRTLYYHALASFSALILGILLQLLLDIEITNIFLYYLSIILIANTFVAIIEFLIINFKDIGKFISLILLVLQLASAGGTFPIETVTKGFRWLHNLLPMTYTINLLKESLVTIESNLLTQNIIIVFMIFIVIFIINITLDIYRKKHIKE